MASGTGIGEFFISLTVDAAQGALTVGDLVHGMGALEVATVAEIGLLWALGVQLARVTDEGIKASLGFEQFTMHTGLSAQQLQLWQIVAQQAHGSAEDVTSSVEALTKHLANLAVGIPDSSLGSLQQLGISAFDASGRLKTAFDILGEVRARLGVITKDAGQQERILAGLGIAPNLRETLLLSNSEFRKRGYLVPGMSEEQEKVLDNLRETFVEISLQAKQLGINLAADVAPQIKALAKWTAMILSDFIAIAGMVAKFAPVQDVGRIIGAGFQGAGDLLNVLAGKGLDVNDLKRLDKIIGGAYTDLHKNFGDFFPESEAQMRAYPGPSQVTVNKQDTYHIQTNDPAAMKDAIERHWDETLAKKTIDGFDRQLGNGGY